MPTEPQTALLWLTVGLLVCAFFQAIAAIAEAVAATQLKRLQSSQRQLQSDQLELQRDQLRLQDRYERDRKLLEMYATVKVVRAVPPATGRTLVLEVGNLSAVGVWADSADVFGAFVAGDLGGNETVDIDVVIAPYSIHRTDILTNAVHSVISLPLAELVVDSAWVKLTGRVFFHALGKDRTEDIEPRVFEFKRWQPTGAVQKNFPQ